MALQRSEAAERLAQCRSRPNPILDALHLWMVQMNQKISKGHELIARALDYNSKGWEALTRLTSGERLAIDNTQVMHLIRPLAIGRNNPMFAGSLWASQQAISAEYSGNKQVGWVSYWGTHAGMVILKAR